MAKPAAKRSGIKKSASLNSSDGRSFLALSLEHPENSDVRIGWLTVTRPIAQRLLKTNTANRDFKTRGVDKIVEDQRSGSWNNQNPDPIVIDETGRLANGQHRLIGVVETGIPIVALVVEGVSLNVMETLDSGTQRTLVDTLIIENRRDSAGHKNLSYLGGVIHAAFRYEDRGDLSQGGGKVFSKAQLLTFYRENREWLERIVSWALSTHRKMPATKNITSVKRLAVFRYALESSGAHVDDIELFFAMLTEDRAAETAVLKLRKRFHSLQAEHNRKRFPLDDLVMALMVKSWNFYVQGEEPQAISWKSGGAKKEKFPPLLISSE